MSILRRKHALKPYFSFVIFSIYTFFFRTKFESFFFWIEWISGIFGMRMCMDCLQGPFSTFYVSEPVSVSLCVFHEIYFNNAL